jgi:hypothetical protein
LKLEDGKINPYYTKTHYIEKGAIEDWKKNSYTPD